MLDILKHNYCAPDMKVNGILQGRAQDFRGEGAQKAF